ncbi:MAG: GIY-YIG nuclease family protein [Nitrospira sp.]|nr:GIY-YIG nuclease family protein [Nitrospira sp.]
MYYVYILRCSDDSFYVGSTHNLEDRVTAHNVGRGSAYTAKRRPVSPHVLRGLSHRSRSDSARTSVKGMEHSKKGKSHPRRSSQAQTLEQTAIIAV